MKYLTVFTIGMLVVGVWLPIPQDPPTNKDLHKPSIEVVIFNDRRDYQYLNFLITEDYGFVMRLYSGGEIRTIAFAQDGRIKTQGFDTSDSATKVFLKTLKKVFKEVDYFVSSYHNCDAVEVARGDKGGKEGI